MFSKIPLQYYAFTGLINFITALVLSFLVIANKPKAKINRLFSLFTLSVALWSLFYFLWLITPDNKIRAEFYLRTCMIFVFFMPPLFLHFVVTFCNSNLQKKYIIINYILAVFFSSLVYTHLYAHTPGPVFTIPYWLHTGPLFHLIILHFGLVIIFSCYLIYKSLKKSHGIYRLQLLYVFIGTLIGFGGGSTNYFSWYRIPFPPIFNLLVSVYMSLIAYAVIRYRLMDIKIFTIRGLIFTIVYTLVLGIPFWLGYTTKSWFSPTALAVFLATLGPFIYNYLRRHAEDVILKEQRRYQQALRELSKKMTRIRDLDLLLKTITATIIERVKVSFAAVYIKDDEYKSYKLRSYYPLNEKTRFQEFVPLDCFLVSSLNEEKRPLLSEELMYQNDINLDSGLVIPCLVEDNLLGFVVLGSKPERQMYTPDDVLVFETLSYSTSLAIENSIFWKEIEERQRQARVQEMNLFSYSLAHEIDNPMHAIIGNSGLLKQFFLKEINIPQEKQQEAEEILGNILDCAHRVAGMVEAIQDLGQRTTGEFNPIKLNEVIDSFSKLYEPIFKNEAVHFTKDIPQELPQVKGVKAELMQVLVIFSNNALHALLGSRGKERRIQLKVRIINREWVRISIIDNGYGIAHEKLKTIFAPFITTKASTEGTGMGLYNAKKIVERHKGKIWAESAGKDKGAAFVVELPIAKGLTAADLKEDPLKGKALFWAEEKEEKDGK